MLASLLLLLFIFFQAQYRISFLIYKVMYGFHSLGILQNLLLHISI